MFFKPQLKQHTHRSTNYWHRYKIPRKALLRKNMLMIQSTINILPLVFAYFITCLRNKKCITVILKIVTFLCNTVSTKSYTINQGIQIHCEWLAQNNLRNQTRPLVGLITVSKMDYRANFQQRSFLTTFTMDAFLVRCSFSDIHFFLN